MGPRFVRYELRTTDVEGARAFYERVIGEVDAIVPLPAAALARGAPAHWLGRLGPLDVEATLTRWTALGAMRLGEGGIVRDPNGAVVGLTADASASRARVGWHTLSTRHVARAREIYVAGLGWDPRPPFALPPPYGTQHAFAFAPDAPVAGAITDITDRPHVHEHWLFSFIVDAIDGALDAVRAGGGEVIDTLAHDGVRSASCHDPQGAIFGIEERRGE